MGRCSQFDNKNPVLLLIVENATESGTALFPCELVSRLESSHNVVAAIGVKPASSSVLKTAVRWLGSSAKKSLRLNFNSTTDEIKGFSTPDFALVSSAINSEAVKTLWEHDIPTAFYLPEAPIKDELRRSFHSAVRYAGVLLFPSDEVRQAAIKASGHVAAMRYVIQSPENPENFVDVIRRLGEDVAAAKKRELPERRVIARSGIFDSRFSYPWLGRDKQAAIATYTTAWSNGINLRKPVPGFHPGIYQEQNRVEGMDPLVHFLHAGKPDGAWLRPVVRGRIFGAKRRSSLRAALQIHLFYPEMSGELIRRIKRSRSSPDLFISVPSQAALTEAKHHFREVTDRRVEIRIVPNEGRDLGPLLTEFADDLQSYEVIGHIHTKKSLHQDNRLLIDRWINFLFENVIGGRKPMIDVVLEALERDPELGLVFPDDPHVIGWMGNRDIALELMQRMGLKRDLPEHFINFPIGTMFWARTRALKPLFDLKLNWADYPKEPVPADGTMLHAIERLLPLIAEETGWKVAVTQVRGVFM